MSSLLRIPFESVLFRMLILPVVLLAVLMVGPVAQAEDPSTDVSLWYQPITPDQSDWSAKRRSGYARSVSQVARSYSAVLEFPALSLQVPVYDDADQTALELGAGWVVGSAFPGETGNVAIAGHRDGFFRPLEEAAVGQEIRLVTPVGSQRYQIEDIRIVDPLDLSVLEPSDTPLLTLITCYPFRYVGFAPDRFIVRARLLDE